ncbi:MAG: right-handed parallel beta-helix repeat-containing protein [Deltaproteobacteria bacterium]|nr:right-handed parallel beta-helix repeat-containing protein [Deltaproteobacteria bacterium]
MIHPSSVAARSVAALALLCTLAPAAHASTLYVANNGVNPRVCSSGLGCGVGAGTPPCRSITCALGSAQAGDTIIVGPGRYGDLDNDGTLGEVGEEKPSASCGCMVAVNKPVILVSSHGAASTVIDGRSMDVAKNVLLMFNGGEFGRPGKGFTVTNTKRHLADGIVIDGTNIKVRGNQVLATLVYPYTVQQPFPRGGISALSGGPILIEGNQVIGQWEYGILAQGTGKTVRKNQVSVSTTYGIYAQGDNVVVGNVVTATGVGIVLQDGAKAVGNAVSGNIYGIAAFGSEGSLFSGAIERNNIASSLYCGVDNTGVPSLNATNNYWGAATGPGPDPADQVCNEDEGTTTVTTPFATVPFLVKAPIKP